MEVPNKNYTLGSFQAWLNEKAKDYSRQLKLVCLFSIFSEWGRPSQILTLTKLLENRGFAVRELGEIRELATSYTDPETKKVIPVKFYCYLSKDNQILRCFTTATTDDINKTLSLATEEPGLYHLWISPQAFEDVKHWILDHRGAKATYFVATRVSSMSLGAKIRPESERTMIYFGDDAQETLEEARYQYGVTPDTVRFQVPGIGSIQVNRRGTFSYYGGEMSFLTETSDLAINRVLQTKKIIDSSKVEVVELKTAKKKLDLTQIKSWTIEFDRSIGPEELEDLFRELESNKFAVYNSVIMRGSLYAESTILDEVKKTVFTVTADSRRISISPRYQSSFESFFRFYQTVVEKFDSGAQCTASDAIMA